MGERNMNLLRILLSCISLVLVPLTLAQTSKTKCEPTALPKDIAEALSTRYSDWKIKTVDDLESYDRELWLKDNTDKCPGIATGHFLNAASQDFALLLVPKVPDTNGYKVIVFAMPDGKASYEARVVAESKSQGSASMVIYAIPPGTYADAEGTRRVQIRLDSFQVEILEASATLYFWRSGQFHHLVTSE
jgi:hypothetical protein